MEAKHTPGPWSVLEHEGEVFVLAGGAMQIASVTYVIEHAGEHGSRRLQNARMFAAALDLLEALQAFNLKEEWIVGGTADALVLRVPLAVIQKAAAAIAKATGAA